MVGEDLMAEKLRKRPFKVVKDEDINPEQIERIHQHYDDRILELDKRRVTQTSTLADGALLADVIAKLNVLLAKLNLSDITED